MEEDRRQKLLNGMNKVFSAEDEANRESEVKPKVWPTFLPTKVYRSRAEWLIQEGLQDGSHGVWTEDKVLQLSWQPESMPTD